MLPPRDPNRSRDTENVRRQAEVVIADALRRARAAEAGEDADLRSLASTDHDAAVLRLALDLLLAAPSVGDDDMSAAVRLVNIDYMREVRKLPPGLRRIDTD